MIGEKEIVCLVSDPARRGVVLSVHGVGETAQYSVFIDGGIQTFYGEQIREVAATPRKALDRETFQAYLASCLIESPSARNLYSLNAARIDYVPYQFRPVLKMLKSDEKRILIADSVGVGKTIEAGLIIKELQAHAPLERIAIICPKPLVAERKWECEMRERFDEDFVALDGASLRDALSETNKDGAWPAKLGRVIIPYSILDERALKGVACRSVGLAEVERDLSFDLVIVDEAHHIRNGSEQSERQFAYKCTKIFCERSRAVVMLTATPIQNKSRDLFTLLNTLRPDLFLDEQSFNLMNEPNSHIGKIVRLARAAQEDWRQQALGEMEAISRTQWGRDYVVANPLFGKCRNLLLRSAVPTDAERVAFMTDVESLHSFSTIINRTRRCDVGDFCIREPQAFRIPPTLTQDRLMQALLNFERQALKALHGETSVAFMMTTLMRQAASCIFGLAPLLRDMLERRLGQFRTSLFDEEDLSEAIRLQMRGLAREVMALAEDLPTEDPKIDKLVDILREKQKRHKNKVMLFSSFYHTLDYVGAHLRNEGFHVGRIDGTVNDDMRRELRKRFMLPRDHADALDVLLFSEVGSEGLDYQFCDMMVNYDLPWNPMAIEQRIGRIDRRGQTSEKVHIVNLLTKGTIDETVYTRCLSKLEVFTRSLGDCEEILGALENDIAHVVLDDRLSDAQRAEKLEHLADNALRATQEELRLEESQREFFGLDLGALRDNQAIEEARSPWLSETCLQHLVQAYLISRLGEGDFLQGTEARKTLRLSLEAKARLLEDLRNRRLPRDAMMLAWQDFLKGSEQRHLVTFNREEARKDESAFFLTPLHPLVKVAASCIAQQARNQTPSLEVRTSRGILPPGRYAFAVFAWNYSGFNAHFQMRVVASDERVEAALPRLLQAGRSVSAAETLTEAPVLSVLDDRHQMLWRNAKDQWRQESKVTAEYKRETLRLSYQRRKVFIEAQLPKSVDERRARMLRAQLDNERERLESGLAKIAETEGRADIVFQRLAIGQIIVED